jgi:hypothetical protein
MLGMETPSKSPNEFGYAIEISRDEASLDEMRKAALDHLRCDPSELEMAIERPARLVIKFVDELAARRFYFSMNGRYIGIPSRPFELRKGE